MRGVWFFFLASAGMYHIDFFFFAALSYTDEVNKHETDSSKPKFLFKKIRTYVNIAVVFSNV